jgi:hypothetical protein
LRDFGRCKHSLDLVTAVKDWSQSPTLALQRDLGICCGHGHQWIMDHHGIDFASNNSVEHG